jgi:dienelactone hydrolase
MSRLALVTAILVVTACATAPVKTSLADGTTGRVGVPSATLTAREFLLGVTSANPVVISAELRLPSGSPGRVPAMVIMHGSGGVGPRETRWARDLEAMGVATLVVDSFTARGIRESATDQSVLSNLAMVVDAYRALALLGTHPRIDPDRIALMGGSRGGIVTLYAAYRRFQKLHQPPGAHFAAYFAFYPSCNAHFRDDEDVSTPLRLLHGEADDWTPFVPCREYVERLRAAGKDAAIIGYPGARHGFDNVGLGPVVVLPRAENYSRCFYDETNPPADLAAYIAGCKFLGTTMGYDARAHADSVEQVKAMLQRTFGLLAR